MRLTGFTLAIAVAAACGKKGDEAADPAPAPPATASDAGLRPPAPAKPKDMLDRAPFVIQLSFAESEQSKDSSSTVVHATVIGDRFFFKEIPDGAHADRRPSLEVNGAVLTAEEVAALKQSIADKALLTQTSIKAADTAPSPRLSVRADLKVRVDDERNQVTVSGITSAGGQLTALAATSVYRNLERLAAELRTLAARKRK